MSKWKTVKLGDVCKVSAGQGAPQGSGNYAESGTPFIKAGDMLDLVNGADELSVQKVTSTVAISHRLKLYPARTLLFAKSGMSATKGHIHSLRIPAHVVSHLACLVADEKQVSPEFLGYYFRQYSPARLIKDSGYPSISLEDISNLQIPLPPLSEQKRIADILDKAAELISLRKQQLEQLDLLIKSQFIAMFGDPVTNEKGWDTTKFESCISFLTSGSRGWAKYYSDEGEMFLTIKNVKNGKISTSDVQYIQAPKCQEATRTRVQEGDLLLSITADLGRTGIVTKEIANFGAYINQHLSLIRLEKSKVASLFVSSYLESQAGITQLQARNKCGVKAGLNFDSIKSVVVLLPPLQLQNEFAEFVEKVEQQKALMQSGLEKLELNYKALMAGFFEASR